MSVLDENRDEIAAFCKANAIEHSGVFGCYAPGISMMEKPRRIKAFGRKNE